MNEPRLSDLGAVPRLNPMCRDWAEQLWLNNPYGAYSYGERTFNPESREHTIETTVNNPTEDYRFVEYARRS